MAKSLRVVVYDGGKRFKSKRFKSYGAAFKFIDVYYGQYIVEIEGRIK
jgi:hypothetical protein